MSRFITPFYSSVLLLFFALSLSLINGCASYRPPIPDLPWLTSSPTHNSQSLVPTSNPDLLWEAIVEAVGQTFTISREEPIRVYGNIMTEGRLETEPKIGSSLMEPWHNDSVSLADRTEATYQTIRRRAVVRVTPEMGGFLVQVVVYCEMEDLQRPIQSPTSSGTFFRTSNQSERVTQATPLISQSNGWFLTGRDPALEQKILEQILHRFNTPASLIRAATSL